MAIGRIQPRTGLLKTDHQALGATPGPGTQGFSEAVGEVARGLSLAVGALLASVPGPCRTSAELAATWGIDVNLAWKLLKIAGTAPGTDALSALRRVPGRGAVRIVLRAADRLGVDAGVMAQAQEAFEAYARLMEQHAGTRSALDSLLMHAGAGTPGGDLAARRSAFRANAATVGVQAEVQVTCYLFWPEQTKEGEGTSAAGVLRGFGGFSRLRGDVAWIIGRGRRSDMQGQSYGQPTPVPIDPDTAEQFGGVPLVRALTAGELPKVSRSYLPDGTAIDRLLSGPVGRGSALTFFMAETIRPGLADRNDPDNQVLRLAASAHTPSEMLVMDVLFHRALPPMGKMLGGLASELGGVSVAFTPDAQRVMLHGAGPLEEHGMGVQTLHIQGLPRYPQLLGELCARLGVRAEDFAAYRLKVAYPPIPCALLLERTMNPG